MKNKVPSTINMLDEFQDTPTPDSQASTIKSLNYINETKPKMPWGRLYATIKNLESFDLQKESYVFGRNIDCDVIITKTVIPENRFSNISKRHFQIVKEAGLPPVLVDLSKNGTFINERLVGRNNRHFLQNDDKISIGFVSLRVYIYKTMESVEDNFLSPSLKERYITSHTIGSGACGEVKLVYEKATCERYAIKRIKKGLTGSNKVHLNHPARIENEIKILKSLSHDCIVQVVEIEETNDYYFIILEYLEGGELTDRILSIESLPECTIKFLFYQILLAVQYLHSKGVTHRDLKPQNVLLVSQAPKTRVKVADFGLSKVINDETCLRTLCGTPHYLAPEIWDPDCKVYDQKADVWSLGVILYYMFAKELPFKTGVNTEELAKMVLNGAFDFDGKVWGRISKEAKDLIKKMLTVDPKQRFSVNDVVMHKWINEDLSLQYDVARILNYIPDSSQSDLCSDHSSEEPPRKKQNITRDDTNSKMRSWP